MSGIVNSMLFTRVMVSGVISCNTGHMCGKMEVMSLERSRR